MIHDIAKILNIDDYLASNTTTWFLLVGVLCACWYWTFCSRQRLDGDKVEQQQRASSARPTCPAKGAESSLKAGKSQSDLQCAPTCWNKGYGKYKYCGLREDPLSGEEPPVYSLSNLPIPIPKLSDAEHALLLKLEERVQDLSATKVHRTDRSTLLRFLRARKGDVAKAETLLRSAADFKRRNDVDNVFRSWNLAAYEQCLAPWWLSGGFVGHGRKGEPVALERLGRCNFAKLITTMPFDVLQKLDIVHSMRCLAGLEEDALRQKQPLKPAIVIVDLEGFGFDQVSLAGARTFAKLVEGRNCLLCEVTGKILVIRAPPAFAKAWQLCKNLLDAGTVEKVEVASTKDTLKTLQGFLDDDVIPAFLGGKRKVDGDPECRKILAPGTMPPKEATDLLIQRSKEGQSAPGGTPSPRRPQGLSDADSSPKSRANRREVGCLRANCFGFI